jgi:hypothetical protein
MKKLFLWCLPLLVWGLIGAVNPAAKSRRSKISVSTRIDKTAIWVGDTLEYTIRAIHDKDVDLVLDNLKKENLNLAPFVVRDISVRQSSYGTGKNVSEITLSLATYESGKPDLRIPPFSLYYFVRAPGLEHQAEAQAETIAVPAIKVGLRSTLTGDNPKLRDAMPYAESQPQQWIIPLILGLSGLAFLALQLGKRAWTALHTVRPQRKRLSPRARERLAQGFVKKIKTMGTESAEDQLRFYAEVSQFLRNYLEEWLEIEARGLTPDEIRSALSDSGRNGPSAEPIKAVLEKCDQVLYAKDGLQVGRKWRDEVQQELERLVRHRA